MESSKFLLVKVGIDVESCFLEICLSVFGMYNLVSGSKRVSPKKFKNSGVKNVFLIAANLDALENYQKVKKAGWILVC